MTQKNNKSDSVNANVKDDGLTKFSALNWMSDSNTKAMIMNAGTVGHIFKRRNKMFNLYKFMRKIGVYIIKDIVPLPHLVQKVQPQLKQRTHGNDFIA